MEKHIKDQSIEQLSTELLKLLKSKGYSPYTLASYRYIISPIGRFMKNKGIAHYSENAGALYYSECIAKNHFSTQYCTAHAELAVFAAS